MTFGSSILLFDHITLNAGSTDTHTFNHTKIAQLSEYFRIVFVANAYNDAIGASPDYTPRIKLRVVAECASGDAYEYVLYPVNVDGMGFRQDIRLRSGEYNLFTFSIINGTSETLTVSNIMFCPESREEDITKIMDSVVNLDKAYYGVTVSEENGLTIERSDGTSEALFNSDTFAMRALIDGIMQDRLYFDTQKGDYVFNGALGADAVFTDSLYAETGDIAELTVDRLSTSRRIRKYILQDTSDDNYILAQDQYLRFITGTPSALATLLTEDWEPLLTEGGEQLLAESNTYSVVQARNRYGELLYWQREPVSHTSDGYPLDDDGVQIYASTNATDWPVYMYSYTEQVKAEFAFNLEDGVYVPQIVLGAGDENGRTIGRIHKGPDGLDFAFTTSAGDEVGFQALSAGFLDLLGLRKPTELNFSDWDNGKFSETLDGGMEATFDIDFDAQDRPIKFTDGDGHETVVIWDAV